MDRSEDERRRHPRFVLSAKVVLTSTDYDEYTETHSFEGINLSQTGMLLADRPRSCKVGVELTVALSAATSGKDEPIKLAATVVRLDDTNGFAIQFKDVSPETTIKLATLLSQLAYTKQEPG